MRKSIVLGIVVAAFALCVSVQASALSYEMAHKGTDLVFEEQPYLHPDYDGEYEFSPIGPGLEIQPIIPLLDTDGDDIPNVFDDDDDNDTFLDDGDGSGVIGDNPCTTENLEDCDDNCTLFPQMNQNDYDEDGIGDACDVCVNDPDPTHQDLDDCVEPVVDDDDDVADDDSGDDDTGDDDGAGDDDYNFENTDGGDDGLNSDVGGLDYLGDGTDAAAGDGAGGCSMAPAAAANPITLILISLSMVPLAIRRKK